MVISHDAVTLQRKLSQEEYRNIDEETRIAEIKCNTTQMAVRDIEKYHSALGKSFLFHTSFASNFNLANYFMFTFVPRQGIASVPQSENC